MTLRNFFTKKIKKATNVVNSFVENLTEDKLEDYFTDKEFRSILLKKLNKGDFKNFGHTRKHIFEIRDESTGEKKQFIILQADKNKWYEIKPIAAGSFGQVYKLVAEIAYDKHTNKFTKRYLIENEKYVVKEQKSDSKEGCAQLKKNVEDEAKFLKENKVKVLGQMLDEQSTFLVMEDCGDDLEKWVAKHNPSRDLLFKIALSIANNYQMLKNLKIYHCDIKPKNICVKEKNGIHTVVFVDFGMASNSETNSHLKGGTYHYMAPELKDGAKPTFASEIYTFGIILKQMFVKNYKEWNLPNSWDEGLKNDFIAFVNKLTNINPLERPVTEYAVKFLSMIPTRIESIKNVKEKNAKVADDNTEAALQNIKKICNELNFNFTKDSVIAAGKKSLYQDRVVAELNNALTFRPLRHAEVIDKLLQVDNHSNYNEFKIITNKEFENRVTLINEQLKKVDHIIKEQLWQAFNDTKFQGTNSSGIKMIAAILNDSNLTVLQKMDRMRAIGKAKIEDNLSNKYNRLSFSLGLFKKPGRNKNVEALYKMLATLGINTNPTDILDHDIFSNITSFIRENTFCSGKERSIPIMNPRAGQ